jgi:hypothetical protein
MTPTVPTHDLRSIRRIVAAICRLRSGEVVETVTLNLHPQIVLAGPTEASLLDLLDNETRKATESLMCSVEWRSFMIAQDAEGAAERAAEDAKIAAVEAHHIELFGSL